MSSQFIKYTSSDVGGPGQITGAAGTLIALYKACLVDGYVGHAAAGWDQPVATAGNIGSFRNGAAGTHFGFVLNDNGPNVTSTFKEAWATGWESVAGVGSPVGTGSGQFPTPAQLLTTGHTVIRKSASADGVGRDWQLFADAYSMLFFAACGDTAGAYRGFAFGDVFSEKGATDSYRCAIIGNNQENTPDADTLVLPNIVSTAVVGHFMARTYGGGGTSITCGKHGDMAKQASATNPDGLVQTPNGSNNAYYIAPCTIHENAINGIRGRIRGLYYLLHPTASFADGQTIGGAGDYAGKTFQIMKAMKNSNSASSILLVETSATLETN